MKFVRLVKRFIRRDHIRIEEIRSDLDIFAVNKMIKENRKNGFKTQMQWKKVEYRRWRKITTLKAEEQLVDLRKGGL